jgi:general secretion pathway protein F
VKVRIWAVRGGGPPLSYEMDAASVEAAQQVAAADGVTVLSARAASSLGSVLRRPPPRFRADLFTQELLALLRAGLTLTEGLRALAANSDANNGVVYEKLLRSLQQGRSFADALHQLGTFPELYVSLIRAAERTSDLPTAMERYLAYASQMDEVRQKVISSSIYPILLIVVGGGVMVFLLTYVVPRFSGVYEGMHRELPWTASLLMHWGRFFKEHGFQAFVLMGLLVLALIGAISSAVVRGAILRRILALPVIGRQWRLFHLARLYRTLGMLLEGGIALSRAITMSRSLLPVGLREAADVALAAIREGKRPSVAFGRAGLSTPIAQPMLTAAEGSGNLGPMMIRVALFYEADTARRMERAMRVVEPVLMALIGLAIGFIVVLMYLPIFELAGAVQ